MSGIIDCLTYLYTLLMYYSDLQLCTETVSTYVVGEGGGKESSC